MKFKQYDQVDDDEVYCLAYSMSRFLLPRIKRFNELDKANRSPEFKRDLKNFTALLQNEVFDNGSRVWTDEQRKISEEGCKAFKRLFYRLWF